MSNLLNKLWYVWLAWNQDEHGEIDRTLDEFVVTQDDSYALGHGDVLGIFLTKREATKFQTQCRKDKKKNG